MIDIVIGIFNYGYVIQSKVRSIEKEKKWRKWKLMYWNAASIANGIFYLVDRHQPMECYHLLLTWFKLKVDRQLNLIENQIEITKTEIFHQADFQKYWICMQFKFKIDSFLFFPFFCVPTIKSLCVVCQNEMSIYFTDSETATEKEWVEKGETHSISAFT